jgi:hypothetical protein
VSQGPLSHVLKLGLLVTMLVFALSACGGGGAEGGGGKEQAEQKEQAKASAIPEEGKPLSPGKYTTTKFKPALSFQVVDEGWVTLVSEQPEYFVVSGGSPESPLYLGFATPGRVYDPERLPKTVVVPGPKDWVGWYRNHPYLKTGKATSVSVGGVSGVQFETEVSSVPRDLRNYCGQQSCIPVWQLGPTDFEWVLLAGHRDQLTILDVGGETVIIDVLAPAGEFDELLPKVQKVLDTVEWEGS